MAIEDIAGAALGAMVDLVNAAVFKDKPLTKRQNIISWVLVLIFVVLLFWFTYTHS